MNALLDAAVAYARHGWYVLPLHHIVRSRCSCGDPECRSPGKHPRTTNGLNEATTDEATIRVWFRRWPNANVGIACGPSGLVVLDKDPRHGGEASFEALHADLGASTFDTLTHLTGGGGAHYIFRAPPEVVSAIGSRANALGDEYPGTDVRAGGGYIVAPPSRHISCASYERELSSPDEPAELPQRLAAMLISAQKRKAIASADGAERIAEGTRHDRLFRAACALRHHGANAETIGEALSAMNAQCDSPLPERELRALARDVTARYDPGATLPISGGQRPALTRDAGGAPSLDIVRLADVASEAVEWLWSSRVPRAKVTLLVGDPGAGKSFASLAVAAAVTNGAPLPGDDDHRLPGNVLLWNGEDGIEDTIRPRAEKAGVNLQRLHVIRGGFDERGAPRPFALADVARLGDELRQIGDVRMVVIDPVSVLLAGVDTHIDAEVRSTLQPLVELARGQRVAVVVVLHLKKGEAERIVYRVGGSIGFVALARSVLLVGADEDGRRAIAPVKSNLCAAPQPVEFSIDGEGRWWWGQANDDLSAEHLLRKNPPERGAAVREAIEFLEETLADGPRPTAEVEAEARGCGITDKTFERARKKRGVKSRRVGGVGDKGKWVLDLPKSAKDATSTPDVLSTLSGAASCHRSPALGTRNGSAGGELFDNAREPESAEFIDGRHEAS
jgi:hypothetical protein